MRNSLLQAAHQQSPLLASQAAAFFSANTPAAAAAAFNQASLFNAQILGSTAPGLQKLAQGDIDLSLPITSTYLRRMRALGLASTGFESQFKDGIKDEVSKRGEKGSQGHGEWS